MVFYDVFGSSIEGFSNLNSNKQDYLALVGNLATSGTIKAKDFIKENGQPIKELAVVPKDLKISDGNLEINGKFTANGEFVVKTGEKVVHNIDKEGNTNIIGQLKVDKNIKVNKSMIGNDPNGFVELRGGTPYIDFSHHETEGDFDNRIILQNKELNVTGKMNVRGDLTAKSATLNGRSTINDQATHIPLVVQSKSDSHIQLVPHNKPNESVYLINRNGGHFRLHSHGVGDTLHVNRDGHTFINSRNNHIPLHVQSTQDAHIRLTGRNNGNNSTYLINRNGGNFMVHQHGVGDVFQVHRNGKVKVHNTSGHASNANDYSMEIFTPQQDGVKETSLRFHQGGRYWHQIRADNTGFRMTTGNNGNLANLGVNTLNATTTQTNANSNIKGDLVFNGGNNWIIHTPNDNRHIMYIAPSTARNNTNWNWGNQFRIESNGTVVAKNLVVNDGLSMMNDTRNVNSPPSFYRNKAKLIGKGAKFSEFKNNKTIQIDVINFRVSISKLTATSMTLGAGFSYVETIVPWPDTSGGRVKQIAYTDRGIRYRVGNANDTAWEGWLSN